MTRGKFRCKACGHKPRRVVSVTSKRKGSIPAEPRQHKKHCDCRCHQRTADEPEVRK